MSAQRPHLLSAPPKPATPAATASYRVTEKQPSMLLVLTPPNAHNLAHLTGLNLSDSIGFLQKHFPVIGDPWRTLLKRR